MVSGSRKFRSFFTPRFSLFNYFIIFEEYVNNSIVNLNKWRYKK